MVKPVDRCAIDSLTALYTGGLDKRILEAFKVRRGAVSMQNIQGLIDAEDGLRDWWNNLRNAMSSSEVVAKQTEVPVVPAQHESQGTLDQNPDSQEEDMMNTQRAMVSADIAVYRQQTTKFTILAATAEIDKVVSFISDARGLFRSEMNKQSLGMIVDCDDGPENHSHPEIIRHSPKAGRYVCKLLEAAALALQDQEFILVFCGASPTNYTKVKSMLAGEGEDSWWADKHNKQIVAEKQLKVAHIYVAYNNRSKGDKRIRGALGAGNVEVVMVVSNMEIHRQKKKPRLSRPEQTTHSQFFDGFRRPSWASCDQMAPELKQEIFDWVSHSIDIRTVTSCLRGDKGQPVPPSCLRNDKRQPPLHDPSLAGKRPYVCAKPARGKLPFTWFPKPPVLYTEVCDALDIKVLIDLNGGSGSRVKSTFILKEKTYLPIRIHSLCHSQAHLTFLTQVVDKFVMKEMHGGRLPLKADLHEVIDKFFKPAFSTVDADDESADTESSEDGDSPPR